MTQVRTGQAATSNYRNLQLKPRDKEFLMKVAQTIKIPVTW